MGRAQKYWPELQAAAKGPGLGPLTHSCLHTSSSARCPRPLGTLQRAPGGPMGGSLGCWVLTCPQETPNATRSVDLRPEKDKGLWRGGLDG